MGADTVDIEGLPVYRVTVLRKERVGDEIHIIHGHELFGRVIWTHVEIWRTSDLLFEAYGCTEISMRPRLLAPSNH